MEEIKWGRTFREFTPEELAHWEQAVREAEEIDYPDLMAQLPILRAKAAEPTISGRLRRAIHTSPHPLRALAARVGTDEVTINAFLLGEQSLPSEVVDRLAEVLGYELTPVA